MAKGGAKDKPNLWEASLCHTAKSTSSHSLHNGPAFLQWSSWHVYVLEWAQEHASENLRLLFPAVGQIYAWLPDDCSTSPLNEYTYV